MTSHDVVSRIRKRLDTRRVGHLGTLDPAATGVLPLTLGKATRLARFILSSPKEYTGEIRLGWSTTTCDLEGERLGESTSVNVRRETLAEAMSSLTGTIRQVPPAYSAKRIDGVKAYKLARRGIPVDLEPVTVEIQSFDLVSFEAPLIDFRVVCSSGTYIRSLARDLGESLGDRWPPLLAQADARGRVRPRAGDFARGRLVGQGHSSGTVDGHSGPD